MNNRIEELEAKAYFEGGLSTEEEQELDLLIVRVEGKPTWPFPWRLRAIKYDISKWLREHIPESKRVKLERFGEEAQNAYDMQVYDRVGKYDARILAKAQANTKPAPGRFCPRCGAELEWGSGYVGETIAFCNRCHKYGWEDHYAAIRTVL